MFSVHIGGFHDKGTKEEFIFALCEMIESGAANEVDVLLEAVASFAGGELSKHIFAR